MASDWSGAVNTAWDTAGNWDTPPVAGGDVVFNVHPSGGTIFACTTPPAVAISMASLTVGVNYSTHPLDFTGVRFATAVINNATITNCGTIGTITSWTSGTIMAGTVGTILSFDTGLTDFDDGTVTRIVLMAGGVMRTGTIGTIDVFSSGSMGTPTIGTIGLMSGGRIDAATVNNITVSGGDINGGVFPGIIRITGTPDSFSDGAVAALNLSGCTIYAYASFTIEDTGANGITTDANTIIYKCRPGITVTQTGVSIPVRNIGQFAPTQSPIEESGAEDPS